MLGGDRGKDRESSSSGDEKRPRLGKLIISHPNLTPPRSCFCCLLSGREISVSLTKRSDRLLCDVALWLFDGLEVMIRI